MGQRPPNVLFQLVRKRISVAGILFLLNATPAWSQTETEHSELPPLWEYGVGLGAVRFWHYPASDQSRDWALPFPTFQYRGEILQADDREGARAYLLRSDLWSVEMGGGGLASVKSEDNDARRGMEDLPWRVQAGPRLVSRFHPEYQVKLGIYQVLIFPDFASLRFQGAISELKLLWHLGDRWNTTGLWGKAKVRSQLGLSADFASQEFMQMYYGVSAQEARADRPAYQARAGFLSYSLSYFQSMSHGRQSYYFGASQDFYEKSANRESPLHKSDRNLSLFIGGTYKLGESTRRAVPEAEAEGAIQKIRHRRNESP